MKNQMPVINRSVYVLSSKPDDILREIKKSKDALLLARFRERTAWTHQ